MRRAAAAQPHLLFCQNLGGCLITRIVTTHATNRDMLLFEKSSLWGCYKLRHVTNRDVLLLATLRYTNAKTTAFIFIFCGCNIPDKNTTSIGDIINILWKHNCQKKLDEKLELVSKELNHLAAILHVNAGGLNFMMQKFFFIIFQEENGNTFTLLIIFIVKSLQNEQRGTNLLSTYYDLQSAGIKLQSPQSDSTPWTLTLW